MTVQASLIALEAHVDLDRPDLSGRQLPAAGGQETPAQRCHSSNLSNILFTDGVSLVRM